MNQSGSAWTVVSLSFAWLSVALLASDVEAGWFRQKTKVRYRFFYVEPPNVPPGTEVPVVVYLHGAGAATLGPPQPSDIMLQRLADDGFLVVAPLYIEGNLVRPHTWQTSAELGISAAFAHIRSRSCLRPDMNRVAFVGESLGGLFGLRLATMAACRSDLPSPRAVILQDGAGYSFVPYFSHPIRDVRRWRYATSCYEDFTAVGDDTLLVSLVAEESWQQEAIEEDTDGDAVFYGNANGGGVVSRGWHRTGIVHRTALIVRGDHSRCPPLLADHGVPTVPSDEIDHLFWSATRTALAAVANEETPDFQADLTRSWSDGSPQLTVVADIPLPEAFAWDCHNILEAAPIARWFLPRGGCAGVTR